MNVGTKNNSDKQKRSDIIYGSASAFRLPIRITSIYQWRIVGLIMLKMQADFGNQKFNFKKYDLKNQKPLLDQIRFNKRTFGSPFRQDEVEIIFPLEFILSRSEHGKIIGYDKAKKALKSLARVVEYENPKLKDKLYDKDCKENGIIWGLAQVIEKPDIRKYNGVNYIYFRVPETTWEVLCHWEGGVHIFELSVFFKFERASSVPFYIFLADHRQKGWAIWSTNNLKELIAPGEYRDYSAFKKKVIIPVQKDLKEHSPFYFELAEFVDKECTIPARRGRGMAANYVKIDIFHQKNKNKEVDERIDLFIEINKLSAFKLEDLTDEERRFLEQSFCFKEIKGKNLETIVKLKYYKNYGHQDAANIWRTNPGNFFMEYLKRLYDTIMLSNKSVKDITAYSIASMQNELEAYEPSNKSPEQIQEKEDAPKREEIEELTTSQQQDFKWLYEAVQSKEWRDFIKRKCEIKNDLVLCLYLLRFRDDIFCHDGHKGRQDLTRHFISLMEGGENHDSYKTLYGDNWPAPQKTYDELKDDPLIKILDLKLVRLDNGGAQLSLIDKNKQ